MLSFFIWIDYIAIEYSFNINCRSFSAKTFELCVNVVPLKESTLEYKDQKSLMAKYTKDLYWTRCSEMERGRTGLFELVLLCVCYALSMHQHYWWSQLLMKFLFLFRSPFLSPTNITHLHQSVTHIAKVWIYLDLFSNIIFQFRHIPLYVISIKRLNTILFFALVAFWFSSWNRCR